MAENDKSGGADAQGSTGGNPQGNPAGAGFPLTVVTQYLKDFSFENPAAPTPWSASRKFPTAR